jgi:hypothetical protein
MTQRWNDYIDLPVLWVITAEYCKPLSFFLGFILELIGNLIGGGSIDIDNLARGRGLHGRILPFDLLVKLSQH